MDQKNELNEQDELRRGELIDFEHMRDCQTTLTNMIQEMWTKIQPRGLVHVNVSGIMLELGTFVKIGRKRTNIRSHYGDLHVVMDWALAVKVLHRYRHKPIVFYELVGMILRARIHET